MNRRSVAKAQKQKNLTLSPSTGIFQRKRVNRIDFGVSRVNTRNSSEQADKTGLPNTESHFSYDFTKIPIRLNSTYPIQAKLKIGQPDDKYEQEADRVAELIMRMPDPRPYSSVGDSSLAISTIPRSGAIQRTCASCLEEYKTAEDDNRPVQPANLCPKCQTQEQGLIQTNPITPLIQAKSTGDIIPEVTPAITAGIQSLQGGGRSLSESELNFFEPRFGSNFSNVRIHNDPQASHLAQSINARAFTHRNHVYFNQRQYNPESTSGKNLIAHELAHTIQQRDKSDGPKFQDMTNRQHQQRISISNYFHGFGSEVLRRTPDFNQTLRFRQRYTYIGDNGVFQSHNFSPDLSLGIRDWLARRMRVFVHDVRAIDTLSRRLIVAFRRAHRILGDRVSLRRNQRYTYTARIDISGAMTQVADIRINDFSPTAELVLSRLESAPPMQWEPAGSPGDCATVFCAWVMQDSETRAPALTATTTLNCWEAILFAAYNAQVVSWQWLHDLYVRHSRSGDIAFANMMSRGRRLRYAPSRQVPQRGDIVFFWSGNQLSHVALATGRLNPRGSSPEVIAFQGNFHEPRPPVRARVEPPSTHLIAGGGRMRIEYARPPW